ncbi:MAG: cytochrome c3 family protein [Gemmatimonadota bacterium]
MNCTTCHDPHKPRQITQQTESLDQACLQCHKANRNHALLSCGICLRLHKGPRELFRESDRDNICGACHLGTPTPMYPGMEPVMGPPVHSSRQGRCRDWHKEH